MMGEASIHYRLDLLVRLMDTTSGMLLREREIRLFLNGIPADFLYKEEGICILVNKGREPFYLKAQVKGFEDRLLWVDYETLDERLPEIELPMVPKAPYPGGGGFYTVKGQLKGISALEGVSCNKSFIHINRMEEENQMVLFNPHNKRMNRSFYALVHQDEGIFEPFTVISRITPEIISIKHPLKGSFTINEPITPVIFGIIHEDGCYLFRARVNQEGQSFLLRYVVEGEERFCRVDFTNQETKELVGWLEGGREWGH